MKTVSPCCNEKTTTANQEDKDNLSQEIFIPENIQPGLDHELLQGFNGRAIGHKAIRCLSENGYINRIRVKYKPKEVVAYFIESEHIEGESKRIRKLGWLVPGPGHGIFYVPEEMFSRLFEIIKDEGRIIA